MTSKGSPTPGKLSMWSKCLLCFNTKIKGRLIKWTIGYRTACGNTWKREHSNDLKLCIEVFSFDKFSLQNIYFLGKWLNQKIIPKTTNGFATVPTKQHLSLKTWKTAFHQMSCFKTTPAELYNLNHWHLPDVISCQTPRLPKAI